LGQVDGRRSDELCKGEHAMPISAQTSDFLVNTTIDQSQSGARTVVLADGRFAVVWTSADNGDGSGSCIRAQVFNADGTRFGGEMLVNTDDINNQNQVTVSALADGRFVVGWRTEDSFDGDGEGVRAAICTPGDLVTGAEFPLNTTTAGNQQLPSLAGLADGGFVATWNSPENGGVVRGRLFGADGTAIGPDFVLSSGSAVGPAAVGLDGGGFMVALRDFDEDSVLLQRFDADGTPAGPGIIASTGGLPSFNQDVAVLKSGGFVVAWTDFLGDGGGSSSGILARVFGPDGVALAGPFLVNTTESGPQELPRVAALTDGRFVVVWESSDTGDGSSGCIRARLFETDGTAIGADFVVNTTANSDQGGSDVTVLADGRFVVTWHSADGGEDNSGTGVRARIFDPTIFNGTAGADTWTGGSLADTITGGDGVDTLSGRGGDDLISGDDGDDNLYGEGGDDRLLGGAGLDELLGGFGRDELFGGAADDVLYIFADDVAGETYDGGAGTDTLSISGDLNTLGSFAVDLRDDTLRFLEQLSFSNSGGAFSAVVRVTADQFAGFTTVTGTANAAITDRLEITMGSVTTLNLATGPALNNLAGARDRVAVVGDSSAETITGSAFADILTGNAGNDTLLGGVGSDLLLGGAGRDTMTGGLGGADIFRFTSRTHSPNNVNRDQIIDFDKGGTADRIDVSKLFGPKMAYIHNAAFSAAGQVRVNDIAGADVIVEVNTGGSLAADFSVRLKATTLASMTAGDFVL
jgi:hypothetical protein